MDSDNGSDQSDTIESGDEVVRVITSSAQPINDSLAKYKQNEHRIYIWAKVFVFIFALVLSLVFLWKGLCFVQQVVNAEVNALQEINTPAQLNNENKAGQDRADETSGDEAPPVAPDQDGNEELLDDSQISKVNFVKSLSGYITILIVVVLAVGLTIFIALLKASIGLHANDKKSKEPDIKLLAAPFIELAKLVGKAFRGGS